jgi:hypothetical protein
MYAWRTYNPGAFSTAPQTAQPSQQSSQQRSQQTTEGGIGGEAGGVLTKSVLSKGGITGSGIADGYNSIYDWATGWQAPQYTMTSGGATQIPAGEIAQNSGTFGGSNIANAAYGYAGGKIANELFDGKGYSDIGGSAGAALGGSLAAGGSAVGMSAGAQFGSFAGPIGALAGAVIGSALGSIFGGGGEDSRFRTYSGEAGDDSQLNIDQINEKRADWDSIGSGQGEAYDRWKGGDYSKNTSSAYKWLKEGNTFSIGDKYTEYNSDGDDLKNALDNDYASYDGPFGKYTVGHVDDIPGRTEFAQGWVDAIGKLDAAVASILTPDQIAASKVGLSGSIQGTPDWHNKSGQNYATDAMIADRYVAIFELSGRDDLAEKLVSAMDRSKSGVQADGGEVARAIPELQKILQAESGSAPQAARLPTALRQPAQRQPVSREARQSYTINRPEGVINPAMEANYI